MLKNLSKGGEIRRELFWKYEDCMCPLCCELCINLFCIVYQVLWKLRKSLQADKKIGKISHLD